MEREDFDIHASDVRVEDSAGKQTLTFRVAVTGRVAPAVETALDADDLADKLASWDADHRSWQEVILLGAVLGQALFPPAVRETLIASLVKPKNNEAHLRLILNLDSFLNNLPWEYALFHIEAGEATQNELLGLTPNVSILRRVPKAMPTYSIQATLPANVLLDFANPRDTRRLRLGDERAYLEQALAPLKAQGRLNPVFVNPATPQSLLGGLAQAQVFHFAGHGGFKEKPAINVSDGVGTIVLDDGQGASRAMDAYELGQRLQAAGVRVAVLGACETGRRDDVNQWSSVAAGLLNAGLGAVVGMQYRIANGSAAEFAKALYEALVAGVPIDEAVALGRVAIAHEAQDARGFGTPVLYMSGTTDGVVFAEYTDNPELQAQREGLRIRGVQRIKEVHGKVIGIDIGELRRDAALPGVDINAEMDIDTVDRGGEAIGIQIDSIGGNDVSRGAHSHMVNEPERAHSVDIDRSANTLSSPEERVVSTGFAAENLPGTPIDPTMQLATGQAYYFWLEVGAPVAKSIEETPTTLPTEFLPKEALLKVALFAFDHEIALTPGADVGELVLQPDGSVRVSRQPLTAIDASQALSDLRLFFPVRMPNDPGTYRLRCNIYYQQILIQSRLISVHVMRQPRTEEGALRSQLDFAMYYRLEPDDLTRREAHHLSIMTNSNGDGTHSFRFLGGNEFKNDATFDGAQLDDLIHMTRGALRQAAWGDADNWSEAKRYRYDGVFNLAQLKDDLISFARNGYRVYDDVINAMAGGADNADKLSILMREPGFMQIALKSSARFLLPAAMIYDYGLDSDLKQSDYTLCQGFLDALSGPAPLETCDCFNGKCPSVGQLDVICPSGFWGYRHFVGLPLSIGGAPDLPPQITYQTVPEFTVGVSTDPAFTQRLAHEQVLHTLLPNLGWNYAATRDQTLSVLKSTHPHVVYFFCHGGVDGTIPYIQVGPTNERGITRDNLRARMIRWKDTRPLVFINGCHTTALEPEQALEFVSAFVENTAASGVIGTEITVFEPLARAFAEECLRQFVGGEPIGKAVRTARLALLKRGNPLGLVYLPFVMADMRLVGVNTR